MADSSEQELIELLKGGDPDATDQIKSRIWSLAARQISVNLRPRVTEDDIVATVLRTVVRNLLDDRFSFESDRQSVWGLLRRITERKLSKYFEVHSALKRDYRRDKSVELAAPVQARCTHAATEISENLDHIRHALTDRQRDIFDLILQGFDQIEIAEQMKMSDRTVRREFKSICEIGRDRLADDDH